VFVLCVIKQKAKCRIIATKKEVRKKYKDRKKRIKKIPVRTRYFTFGQTGRGAHTVGTGLFPEINQPRRGVKHPHPSSTGIKETVELYLYSPSGLLWPVTG
jgi:hypothetical protein